MITGQEKPDRGALRVGESVSLAYVDQSRDSLDPAKNVWEEISGGQEQLQLGTRQIASRAYVGLVQLQGLRPAEAGGRPLGRRAEPRSTSR